MAAPSSKKIYTAIVLDFETGGTDCKKDGITQIAAHAIRLDTFEVIGKYKDYISLYPKPEFVKRRVLKKKREAHEIEYMNYNWKMMEEKTSITRSMLEKQGVDIKIACKNFIELCEKATLTKGCTGKPILVGQNIPFDIGFLKQMFFVAGEKIEKCLECHKDFDGYHPTFIDTLHQARLTYANDETFASYSLGQIAEALEVELDDAHDADADVEATREILRILSQRMRNKDGQAGGIEKVKTRKHFKF